MKTTVLLLSALAAVSVTPSARAAEPSVVYTRSLQISAVHVDLVDNVPQAAKNVFLNVFVTDRLTAGGPTRQAGVGGNIDTFVYSPSASYEYDYVSQDQTVAVEEDPLGNRLRISGTVQGAVRSHTIDLVVDRPATLNLTPNAGGVSPWVDQDAPAAGVSLSPNVGFNRSGYTVIGTIDGVAIDTRLQACTPAVCDFGSASYYTDAGGSGDVALGG